MKLLLIGASLIVQGCMAFTSGVAAISYGDKDDLRFMLISGALLFGVFKMLHIKNEQLENRRWRHIPADYCLNIMLSFTWIIFLVYLLQLS